MPHSIEIVDNQMCVMDEDGTVHAVATLDSYRAAKRQIQEWTTTFTLDVADAYNRLAAHVSQR